MDSCWCWSSSILTGYSSIVGGVMNFLKYQEQAWSTAIYDNKGNNSIYVCEGLDGESGEVQEIIKRLHRGQELDLDKLKGESGDNLWYIQGMYSEYGLLMPDREMDAYQNACAVSHKAFNLHHWSLRLGSKVGRVLEWVDELIFFEYPVQTTELQVHLEDCLITLTMLIHTAGLQLEDIAQFNLDKLASRQERGVLSGTGSDR